MHLCNERSEIKIKLDQLIEYNKRCRRFEKVKALEALDPETCTGQAVVDIEARGQTWEFYFYCDVCHEQVDVVIATDISDYSETIEICEKCSRKINDLLQPR